MHCLQSLSRFPSIVSSLIALLPPEFPFSAFCFSLSLGLFFLSSYTHSHTLKHTSSGPESGRAAAKGLTNAGWREVTALCITPWHWQLTDGYHSPTLQGERERKGGNQRSRKGESAKEDDSPALFSFHGAVVWLSAWLNNKLVSGQPEALFSQRSQPCAPSLHSTLYVKAKPTHL